MSAQRLYCYDSDSSSTCSVVAPSWDSLSDCEDLSPNCAHYEDDGDSNDDELDEDFFECNLTSVDSPNEGIYERL